MRQPCPSFLHAHLFGLGRCVCADGTERQTAMLTKEEGEPDTHCWYCNTPEVSSHGLQLQPLVTAYSCSPCGQPLLQL